MFSYRSAGDAIASASFVTVAGDPPARRVDRGTAAVGFAVALTLVALAGPVATTRSTDGAGVETAVATAGWFGTLTSTGRSGARTVTADAVPAFGWAALAGVLVLLVAAGLRLRTRRAPALTMWAAGWLATTGVLVLAHTAARAGRLRDVLSPMVPGQLVLTGSPGPWLLIAAGVVAGAAALAPRRVPRPPRASTPPLARWQPLTGKRP